jgi:hypothetical protein
MEQIRSMRRRYNYEKIGSPLRSANRREGRKREAPLYWLLTETLERGMVSTLQDRRVSRSWAINAALHR